MIPAATSGYVRFFTREQKEYFLGNSDPSKSISLKNRVIQFEEISQEQEEQYFEKVRKRKEKVKLEHSKKIHKNSSAAQNVEN